MTDDDVVQLAGQIPIGVWAAAVKKKYSISLSFATTGAIASYDPNTSTCFLNSSKSLAIVVAYFVHEMNHANQHKSGKTANAKELDQDTFVSKMVKEEVDGTYFGFRAFLELEQNSLTKGSAAPDRYDFFKSAYKRGRELAAQADKSLDEKQLHERGLVLAYRQTQNLIGERFLGPNQLQSYGEYYKGAWVKESKK